MGREASPFFFMLSDREKIEHAKKILRRRFLGTVLSAGPLGSGKTYVIIRFKSGDDFRNVGALRNREDLLFTASGTTPTAWSHGSQLQEWKLAELKALAETAFTGASKTVTITSSSFEGGQGSGEITFDRSILWLAVEQLIEETDPGFIMSNRPTREIGFTVRVG
jgi:hypothetical protein